MSDQLGDKVLAIFRALDHERADRLRGNRPAVELMETVRVGLADDYPDELASDVAFHLADWNADAAFLVALNLFPERFTREEISEGIRGLLIHAPNHLAAAAKLGGFAISDIFKVGPLVKTADNHELLWTGPGREVCLFFVLRPLARRVAGHRTLSVIPPPRSSYDTVLTR